MVLAGVGSGGPAAGARPAERCDLLIGLGTAQLQVGEAAFRETLLKAAGIASDLGDGERAARAALANNRGQASNFGGLDGKRMSALTRAPAADPTTWPDRRACWRCKPWSSQADHDHERRQMLADEALARARQAEDPRTLGYVLQNAWNRSGLRTPSRSAPSWRTSW